MTQKQTAPQGGEAAALPANCYHATSTVPTLADFEAWALKKRRNALDRLSVGGATDAAFEALFAECSKFNGTYEALLDFADDNGKGGAA